MVEKYMITIRYKIYRSSLVIMIKNDTNKKEYLRKLILINMLINSSYLTILPSMRNKRSPYKVTNIRTWKKLLLNECNDLFVTKQCLFLA